MSAMGARLAAADAEVFTINPRDPDERTYWASIQRNAALSGAHGATGVLCFSGNDTLVDPWLAAEHVARAEPLPGRPRLVPLVALNPLALSPYSAAKMVTSLAYLHGVRTDLNLVTGVSSRDRDVLCDGLPHDERYARLDEYAGVVDSLLTQRRPTTFEGAYYRIRQALLAPRLPEALFPRYFVAGHSPAARRTAERFGATRLEMLSPALGADLPAAAHALGMHFGIVTRPRQDDAWRAAHGRFPPDLVGEKTLELSMRYTDSVWKHDLRRGLDAAVGEQGYWLQPFRTFRADCPFLVGSHAEVAAVIRRLLERGVRRFVLDLVPEEEEFANAAAAFALAYERAGSAR